MDYYTMVKNVINTLPSLLLVKRIKTEDKA